VSSNSFQRVDLSLEVRNLALKVINAALNDPLTYVLRRSVLQEILVVKSFG